ncbi:hypothetical protein CPB84DRAFT_1853270 [Gymnopilus junonius]|uniref:Uncharacterized protein n=1 Tax=Gymnopilus junonius TaxID=109634 RepID=A0A9P5N8W5_GYMJU|nr:hypothetical protein CPB84DRAFT_1853270 [Gymnopilus junonius]
MPLTLLTDSDGVQSIHVTPEAFEVASAEFANEIQFWQNALPGPMKGQLTSVSRAKVLLINGQNPFIMVDANVQITGGFQGFGMHQNFFFASYNLASTGWTHIMGDFAQQSLFLNNSVTLTILQNGHTSPEVITQHNNQTPLIKFQQQPPIPAQVACKQPLDVMLNTSPPSDIVLPPSLQLALPAIVGPKPTTIPQAGLDTKVRDGPLAQLTTDWIVNNDADPLDILLYNPINWPNASNVFFALATNWLQPPILMTINDHADAFTQRVGEECPLDGFPVTPPANALFDIEKVAIVSNGR